MAESQQVLVDKTNIAHLESPGELASGLQRLGSHVDTDDVGAGISLSDANQAMAGSTSKIDDGPAAEIFAWKSEANRVGKIENQILSNHWGRIRVSFIHSADFIRDSMSFSHAIQIRKASPSCKS